MSPAAKTKARPPDRGRGRLVLIVDDVPDNRELYVQYLTYFGYRAAEAGDGQDALTKAAALKPDVIVMDLSLPGMDGWEATRRLKADSTTRNIPVIALTGHALSGSDEHARAAGCDAFLTKPCDPADLAATIDRLSVAGGEEKTS
jgi:two-component system cell cycle response regulator DivK